MFKRTAVLVAIAVAVVFMVSVSAWAIVDYFSTKGIEKLCNNPQIASSGIAPRLKSISHNFEMKLQSVLMNAGGGQKTWVGMVSGAMNKGAELCNTKAFEMTTGKSWEVCCQEYLISWTYGGLELSADTKHKIDTLTYEYFRQMGEVLSGMHEAGGKLR